MKKRNVKQLLTLLAVNLSLVSSITATAQLNSVTYTNRPEVAFPVSEYDQYAASKPIDPIVVEDRVSSNFTKEFAGVSNAVWTKADDGYVVRFTKNGIQNWAFLNRKGNCHTTLRYYTEKELSTAVQQQVKQEYAGYSINAVKELHTKNQPITFLVTISDATAWKVIRVSDGETEVVESYLKG